MSGQARTLILVWAALLGLLLATVASTFLPLGAFRTAAALGFAAIKAALIAWFYMHLRQEGGLVRLAAATGIVWLLLMIGIMSADYLTRQA